MKTFACLILLATILNLVVGASTATTAHPACLTASVNGVIELGCWGYRECVNGVVVETRCTDDQVFERDTMSCVAKGTGNTDCDSNNVCTGKVDGMYPDLGDSCQTYIRCSGGANLGVLYCPASLVFNEKLQVCDYAGNVAPPCGTATPT